mmetsp:Transcript_73199/g.174449  ORF Transcript_73199/g.174449 Transcript_73199/m.174449 type:complete len:204 (-) Transcript_73199:297-908(-)
MPLLKWSSHVGYWKRGRCAAGYSHGHASGASCTSQQGTAHAATELGWGQQQAGSRAALRRGTSALRQACLEWPEAQGSCPGGLRIIPDAPTLRAKPDSCVVSFTISAILCGFAAIAAVSSSSIHRVLSWEIALCDLKLRACGGSSRLILLLKLPAKIIESEHVKPLPLQGLQRRTCEGAPPLQHASILLAQGVQALRCRPDQG